MSSEGLSANNYKQLQISILNTLQLSTKQLYNF